MPHGSAPATPTLLSQFASEDDSLIYTRISRPPGFISHLRKCAISLPSADQCTVTDGLLWPPQLSQKGHHGQLPSEGEGKHGPSDSPACVWTRLKPRVKRALGGSRVKPRAHAGGVRPSPLRARSDLRGCGELEAGGETESGAEGSEEDLSLGKPLPPNHGARSARSPGCNQRFLHAQQRAYRTDGCPASQRKPRPSFPRDAFNRRLSVSGRGAGGSTGMQENPAP